MTKEEKINEVMCIVEAYGLSIALGDSDAQAECIALVESKLREHYGFKLDQFFDVEVVE